MAKAAKSYRYERKFVVTELSLHEIESVVRLHPAMFFQPFQPRYVNNIYYDSVDLASYFGNLDGTAQRVKVRIRWYGDLLGRIEKPTLELKIKSGSLGTKRSYPLPPFSLTEDRPCPTIAEVTDTEAIPETLKWRLLSLRPSLLNRYYRRYYESADHKYRITIDDGLDYYAVSTIRNSFSHRFRDSHTRVVELKYDQTHAAGAGRVVNAFPFRLSRNSKYINGIDRIMA